MFDNIGERFVDRHLAVIDGALIQTGGFCRLDHKITGMTDFFKTSRQ